MRAALIVIACAVTTLTLAPQAAASTSTPVGRFSVIHYYLNPPGQSSVTLGHLSGDRAEWICSDNTSNRMVTWTPATGVQEVVRDTPNDLAVAVRVSLSGDRIAWHGSYDDTTLFTWTPASGIVSLPTADAMDTGDPAVSGDRVVWWEEFAHWPHARACSWTPTGGRVVVDPYDDLSSDCWGAACITNVSVCGDTIAWGRTFENEDSIGVFAGTAKLSKIAEFGIDLGMTDPIVTDGGRVTWTRGGTNDDEPWGKVVQSQGTGGLLQLDVPDGIEAFAASGDRVVWWTGKKSAGDIYTWTPQGGVQKVGSDWYEVDMRVSGDLISWTGHHPSWNTMSQLYGWDPSHGVRQLTHLTGRHPCEIWDSSGGRVLFRLGTDTGGDQAVVLWTPGTPTLVLATLSLGLVSQTSPPVLAVGRSCRLSGKVTPLRPNSFASVVVQRKVSGVWRAVTKLTVSLNDRASFSRSYKPSKRGTYRFRTLAPVTEIYQSGASAWKTLVVR